ncbi:LIPOPROTEIN [Mycoplasmopsis pulmonis]|uniref:LIPOPROTEIN n=1 Tax=Mycoplasmopsis pulmonis (strain UAB CTIP) TaxID=272635 RepID=Q98QP1_MYCPU|nr:lipoprotein [Mycoplasmopsis pulmonis]CAC13493.1 LIPOPROTEIN [Mycoplasmopsis pulmonis]
MKNKKILLEISSISTLALSSVFVSCIRSNDFSDKVIIQTAQGASWPLMPTFQKVVELYNKSQKDTNDFLEVELQDASITKTFDEDELARNVTAQLKVANNNNIPNLILNNHKSAHLINEYQRLLDFTGTKISKDLYFEGLYNLHNKVIGQSSEKLFSIPFNVASLDSLVFNIDIMAHIFEQIKAGGGKITLSETNPLKMKIDKAKTEGNSEIPEGKIWRYLIAKSNNAYSNFNVQDWHFQSYQGLQEFASKVYDGLKLQENLNPQIQEKLLKDKNANIFKIDYQELPFQKLLFDKINSDKDTNNFLWNLKEKTDAQGQKKSTLEYTINNSQELQNILKQTYEEFTKDNKQTNIIGSGINAKKLNSIHYAANGSVDWTSWDIRNYNSAFGFSSHVGITRSYDSPHSRRTYVSGNEQEKKKIIDDFPKWEDVYWSNQVTKVQKDSKHPIFYEGGSSLVAIKTTSKRDKATIKFLEWIYEANIPGTNQKVWSFLQNGSSYVFPTKQAVTDKAKADLESLISSKEKELESLKNLANPTQEQSKRKDQIEDEIGPLRAANLSLEDILNIKKQNQKTLNIQNDDLTIRVISTIATLLFNTTLNDPKKVSSEEFLETIMRMLKH